VVSEDPPAASSRRGLLIGAGAAAAGAAAAIAACGSKGASQTTSGATPSPASLVDIQLLNRALELERRTAALYTATVPLLTGRAHAAGKLFLAQELAHASELTGLIQRAGGKPRMPRASYNLGHPRGPHEVFRQLIALENAQVAGYLDAIAQLSTAKARAAVASILANDAQHLSVALLTLGRNPIPAAFVTGRI
jgi:bacterioferritin (cytochrome b1)